MELVNIVLQGVLLGGLRAAQRLGMGHVQRHDLGQERVAWDANLPRAGGAACRWICAVVFGESAGAVAGLFGKATAKITDDLEVFLAFYDYPAEHWIHLRTTNPIESTFATVRHRTKITRGPAHP